MLKTRISEFVKMFKLDIILKKIVDKYIPFFLSNIIGMPSLSNAFTSAVIASKKQFSTFKRPVQNTVSGLTGTATHINNFTGKVVGSIAGSVGGKPCEDIVNKTTKGINCMFEEINNLVGICDENKSSDAAINDKDSKTKKIDQEPTPLEKSSVEPEVLDIQETLTQGSSSPLSPIGGAVKHIASGVVSGASNLFTGKAQEPHLFKLKKSGKASSVE